MTVELFAVKGSKLPGVTVHEITAREEYDNILKPMYDFALPPQCAHMIDSLDAIKRDGAFDIIHDHNYFIGPSILAYAAGQPGIPPAIHTIHGPPSRRANKSKKAWPTIGTFGGVWLINQAANL